jgi:acid-sensing ion channel, other
MFKAVSKNVLNDIRRVEAIKALRKPRKTFKVIFQEWLKEKVNQFCNVTSLHGYIHTVKEEYRPYERYLWILLSISALIAAIILLWISWNWSALTPTTTVIESTNFPTYNLPFPSVTICNINLISKKETLKLVKDW